MYAQVIPNTKGRKILVYWVLLVRVMPLVSFAIPFYIMFTELGILATLIPVNQNLPALEPESYPSQYVRAGNTEHQGDRQGYQRGDGAVDQRLSKALLLKQFNIMAYGERLRKKGNLSPHFFRRPKGNGNHPINRKQ